MNKMATRAKKIQILLNISANFNQTSQEYCLLKLHNNVARWLSTKIAKIVPLQRTRLPPELKQIFKWQILLNPLANFNRTFKIGY